MSRNVRTILSMAMSALLSMQLLGFGATRALADEFGVSSEVIEVEAAPATDGEADQGMADAQTEPVAQSTEAAVADDATQIDAATSDANDGSDSEATTKANTDTATSSDSEPTAEADTDAAPADGPVSYLDADGAPAMCDAYTLVDETNNSWQDGWYVLATDTTIERRIFVTGDVYLILCDGATLNSVKGIEVNPGNKLTVYSQEQNTGKIVAVAAPFCAGIGGGCGSSAGTLSFFGGHIDAIANQEGAGIGGGQRGRGGEILIAGNTVIERAQNTNTTHNPFSPQGAGIGGGDKGTSGNITITGNVEVHAQGGSNGAGIGGGCYGNAETIRIESGTVYAEAGEFAAGIGGGHYSELDGARTPNGGDITITGGVVHAKGNGGSGIGSGQYGRGGTLTISGGEVNADFLGGALWSAAGEINITGGTINANMIGTRSEGENPTGGTINISGGTINAQHGIGGNDTRVNISGGNVVARPNVTMYNHGPIAAIGGDNAEVHISWTNDTDSFVAYDYAGRLDNTAFRGTIYLDASFRNANDRMETFRSGTPSNPNSYLKGKTLVPYSDTSAPELVGQEVSLDGTLGLTTYVLLHPSRTWDGSYMKFEVLDGNGARTVTVPLDEHHKDATGRTYAFTLPLSCVEMAQHVKATFYYNDESEQEEQESNLFNKVFGNLLGRKKQKSNECANSIVLADDLTMEDVIASFEDSRAQGKHYDNETVALVHAIANYCHFAQPFMAKQNKWTLGEAYAEAATCFDDGLTVDEARSYTKGYTSSVECSRNAITRIGMAAELNSTTTLRFTLKADNATLKMVSARMGDERLDTECEELPDGSWRLNVLGIRPDQFGETITVTGSLGGPFAIETSVLALSNTLINNASQAANGGHDAIAALCSLHKAACDYRKAQQG